MLAYLFHWRLNPGLEAQFQEAWAEVTRELLTPGSRGSALFDTPDGTVCGIARWPDLATREAAAVRNLDARQRMNEVIAETLQAVPLNEWLNLRPPFPVQCASG